MYNENQKIAINSLARKLWEKAGKPKNKDLDFWLQAEHELFNTVEVREINCNCCGNKFLTTSKYDCYEFTFCSYQCQQFGALPPVIAN